jgi:hypothetical protein
MKKFVLVLMIITGMSLILTGCSSIKLSDDFDKDTVEKSAKQVVEYLNAGDYDKIFEMSGDVLTNNVSEDDLSKAVDKTFGDAGAFVKYKNVTIIGQKMKKSDENTAVAVLVAEYENQKVTFTISFDTDMKLIGLFMK